MLTFKVQRPSGSWVQVRAKSKLGAVACMKRLLRQDGLYDPRPPHDISIRQLVKK